MPRLRGAIPSPRHKLAAAVPHRIVGPTPIQFLWSPTQLSMWDNDVDGVCVTAEEALKCSCSPKVFITDDTVIAWATKNSVLNGADLTQVLDLMQSGGFPQDGVIYNDGPYTSVDWTNSTALQNAIAQGPVKIGVAADQLENAAPEPPVMGWLATGFAADANEDHCVSLVGFGTIAWLSGQIQLLAQKLGLQALQLPDDGMNVTQQAYALFTWKSIGIIDVPSLLAICGEAWLRNPSTLVAAPVPEAEYGG